MGRFMRNILFSLLLLFSPFLLPRINSQPINDSVFYNDALGSIKAAYYASLKADLHIYNGIEYDYFGRGSNGSPFFISDTMQQGSIFYDGNLYENIPLRYDMVNDALLVRYWKDNNTISLIRNKVLYFIILGHKFIRFNENEQSEGDLSGFYELLYNDEKTLVFAKRFKKLLLSSSPDDKLGTFVQYNQYFIYKDEKYYPVSSQKDLQKIFGDKEQQVKKFLRTEKSRLKSNLEQLIVATALFYHGLMK